MTKLDLEQRVREWALGDHVVEKDYVLGWLLWGIGSEPALSDSWAFKGGTCLKKCYIETYRFSEDLDFTVLPGGPISPDVVLPVIRDVLERVGQQSGIRFDVSDPILKASASGDYVEGRIYYQGPRGARKPARVKLDLSASEVVARPTVLRPIAHPYPDELESPAAVRCYSFEEVFAEKIRAMGERGRSRDLYDIIHLYRRGDLRSAPELIRNVLQEKCRTKGVPVPTLAGIESAATRAELEAEWANMLAHQLPELPPFAAFWNELAELFDWLEGRGPDVAQLIPLPALSEEEDWSPPATVWVWGFGVPVESLRFAGANRLCVRLGYGGSIRQIEPYSLRRTREGNIVLHAIRVDSREHRSYRLDRITRVEITTTPFTPVRRGRRYSGIFKR